MLSEQNKVSVNIEDEMRKSYMDYAMSVIVGRALPDVRDGLKPVHRRVLFAMNELNNDYNKPYKKSARVVGDVIGKYHPHGDSAVYDTIVRMAQDFSMRHPLVDGQGNFGSVDGDSAAAMRYTEVRMDRLAHELLNDLDKETVEFGPNYDDSLEEPLVLPCKYPNLLVNGSEGIAVGMATKIPPHNLGEIIDGLIAVIDNPKLEIEELLELIPGPDFPTAGFIMGRDNIHQAYRTGRGIIPMRAKAMVEQNSRTSRESIIVTEIPFQVNKARLIEKIADLVRDKKIEGISDLRDESDRDGMLVTIAGHAATGAVRCDDRVDVDLAALPVDGAVATEHRVKECAAVVRYLLGVVKTYRFAVVNPLERHSCNVGPENLLRDIGNDSGQHARTSCADSGCNQYRSSRNASLPNASQKSTDKPHLLVIIRDFLSTL